MDRRVSESLELHFDAASRINIPLWRNVNADEDLRTTSIVSLDPYRQAAETIAVRSVHEGSGFAAGKELAATGVPSSVIAGLVPFAAGKAARNLPAIETKYSVGAIDVQIQCASGS